MQNSMETHKGCTVWRTFKTVFVDHSRDDVKRASAIITLRLDKSAPALRGLCARFQRPFFFADVVFMQDNAWSCPQIPSFSRWMVGTIRFR